MPGPRVVKPKHEVVQHCLNEQIPQEYIDEFYKELQYDDVPGVLTVSTDLVLARQLRWFVLQMFLFLHLQGAERSCVHARIS
jgi:hypothetical protein